VLLVRQTVKGFKCICGKHSASKCRFRVWIFDSKMLCLITVASILRTVHRSIMYNYIHSCKKCATNDLLAYLAMVLSLTLGAHARGGLWYLVCVCVFLQLYWQYSLRGGPGLLAIPTAWARKTKLRISWNHCVQEICRENKAKMSICKICTGIPRTDPVVLCILEAQEGTTKGLNRLTHAIY
jgi:hypothetical protein